jgi:hypothetical protein
MSITINAETGEIRYNGKVIGRHEHSNGVSKVSLSLEYEAGDDWVVPISLFAYELQKIDLRRASKPELTVTTSTEYEDVKATSPQFLAEFTTSVHGHTWSFHKSDRDAWPSVFHGHDYQNKLKVDVLTGNVYDAVTKSYRHKLSYKDLKHLRAELKSSKDFSDKCSDFTLT